MSEKLKTQHVQLDLREALRSSPDILLGVTADAASALRLVEIESVFDLATSRLFANASRLLRAGLDPKDSYYRFGTAPKDVVRPLAIAARRKFVLKAVGWYPTHSAARVGFIVSQPLVPYSST